jgi:hypothetical protein
LSLGVPVEFSRLNKVKFYILCTVHRDTHM